MIPIECTVFPKALHRLTRLACAFPAPLRRDVVKKPVEHRLNVVVAHLLECTVAILRRKTCDIKVPCETQPQNEKQDGRRHLKISIDSHGLRTAEKPLGGDR